MASSSEAHAPGWTAHSGLTPGAGEQPAPQPAWITALGANEQEAQRGFCDASPFEPLTQTLQPNAPPRPDSERNGNEHVPPDDEAYRRGFADGHAEAKRAGDLAFAGEQERLRELRLAFCELDTAGREALVEELQTTVLTLCKGVLGEYALDREALMARCEITAKRLGAGPRGLTLHLNPATRAALDAEALAGWELEDDLSLDPGALRLTSADGEVRDGPEDWMRALSEALRS
ncbi:MAG: hypothetical protein AAF251_06965 [Pseudomonadota bacterium]